MHQNRRFWYKNESSGNPAANERSFSFSATTADGLSSVTRNVWENRPKSYKKSPNIKPILSHANLLL
jgi:hypothetical protein